MNVAPLVAKRKQIGLLALVCLVLALGLWLFTADPEHNPLLAAVTRVGIVLGALWLALPAAGTNWAWRKAGPALILSIVLVAFVGRTLRYAIPVALVIGIALVFLRPRPRKSARS